jgi:hypothetical protein
MSRIISFRGLIKSGGQDTLPLQTNNGLMGYRIVKFQMMTPNAGTTDYEHTMQIWKTDQTGAITAEVNFSDNRLLAAGFIEGAAATNFIGNPLHVIFDNEKFNQDIYITHFDSKSALACNYYIELEQMKLNLDEQTVATLKDIRNTGSQ